jgi:hypothetical protein
MSYAARITAIIGKGSKFRADHIIGMSKLNPDNDCMSGTSDVCITDREASTLKTKLKLNSTKLVDIVNESKEKLKCNSEACVVKSIEKEHPNVRYLFKAKGPLNPETSIDSDVLDDVIARMEYNYDGFVSCKFVMRDFDTNPKYPNNLHRTNLVAILNDNYFSSSTGKRGGNYFACIINTDLYLHKGIHWVCVVADMRKQPFKLMYFNSLAKDDPDKSATETRENAKRWLESQQKYLSRAGYKSEVIMVDTSQHQKENVVCGLYVLFFILSMYNGVPLEVFTHMNVDDELMAVPFRNAIFL